MKWFTGAQVRRLATGRSFERGLDYVDSVRRIRALPDGVVATVMGSEDYQVRLRVKHGKLAGAECDCPYGEDGNFCKHCVGLCLRLLRSGLPASVSEGPDAAEVLALLAGMERDELERIVWQRASEDPELYAVLRRRVYPSFVDGDEGEEDDWY